MFIWRMLVFWFTHEIHVSDGGGLSKHSGGYGGGQFLGWQNLHPGESECNGQRMERAAGIFETITSDYYEQQMDNRAAKRTVKRECGFFGKTITSVSYDD